MKKQIKAPVRCLSAICGLALSQTASSDLVTDNDTLNFGARWPGSTTYLDVTITNNGNAALSNVTLTITGHKGAFRIVHGCGASLFPANWCTATIAFRPLRQGRFHNRLNVDADEVVDGNTNSYSTTVKLEGATLK
jgi:hypothetical protein